MRRIKIDNVELDFIEENIPKIQSLYNEESAVQVQIKDDWYIIPKEEHKSTLEGYFIELKIQEGKKAIEGKRPAFDLASNIKRKERKKINKRRAKKKANKKYKK